MEMRSIYPYVYLSAIFGYLQEQLCISVCVCVFVGAYGILRFLKVVSIIAHQVLVG